MGNVVSFEGALVTPLDDTIAWENLLRTRNQGAREGHLVAVPRNRYRAELPEQHPSCHGRDVWNAYELLYLDAHGRTRARHLQCSYDSNSPAIVESKSFKLYLNRLHDAVFQDEGQLKHNLHRDLKNCIGAPVDLVLFAPDTSPHHQALQGQDLDQLNDTCSEDPPHSPTLEVFEHRGPWQGYTHGFLTHCPLTGQPDWAAVQMSWEGDCAVRPQSLMRYLAAYRRMRMFHEACCERIFSHLYAALTPRELEVRCHFTRRGGLDITPIRSLNPLESGVLHPTWRQ